MKNPLATRTARERLILVINVVAIIVGLFYGYDFGHRIGGSWILGVVAALNTALFCSLFVDFVADRVFRQKTMPRDEP